MATKTTSVNRSRWIKGTLTREKENPYLGTPEERQEIIDTLVNSSSSYLACIVSLEKHEDEAYHYHFFARYSTAIKVSVVERLREHFDQESKTNQILLGKGHCNVWVVYVCKDGDYTTHGTPDIKLDSILNRCASKKSVMALAETEGVIIRAEVLKDHEIVQWLHEFMSTRGYKVNFHTRKLVGTTRKRFFQELNDHGFSKLFGDYGVKLATRHITEDTYYDLPIWEPDFAWVSFSDGMWNVEEGRFYPTSDLPKPNIIPVREYQCPYSDEDPKLFLDTIKRMGWDIDHFRDAYGSQFREKRRRDKCLLIYGSPLSGKSTIIQPYIDVFKDVIGEWSDDSGFSYAAIAPYLKAFSEEVDIFDFVHNINGMKKLTEGTEFQVKKKHSEPVTCVPKTMMIVSNDPPPESDNVHVKALKDRVNIFKANNRVKHEDKTIMDRIRKEAPQVLVWATKQVE